MNKFTIASVAVATALLAGCGGSSSSGGDGNTGKPPVGGEAEVCFNPALWENSTHTAKWQTRYETEGSFYPNTENYIITTDIDFEEHKSATRVETVYSYSESPVGVQSSTQARPNSKSRSNSWQNFDYYLIDESSQSVFHAGDYYVGNFDGIVEEDFDVNSPAAPMWLFGSDKGQITEADYSSEFSFFIDGELIERVIYGQNKRKVTYNGIESIDVNGIPVEACSFTVHSVLNGNVDGEVWTETEIFEQWIDTESGLLVKSVINTTDEEDGEIVYEYFKEQILEEYSIDEVVIFTTRPVHLPE